MNVFFFSTSLCTCEVSLNTLDKPSAMRRVVPFIYVGYLTIFSLTIIMTCVCSRYHVRFDWLMLWHKYPLMPTGHYKLAKKNFKKPYNNQLIDLESSARLGLGLRFSLKVLTLGYEVAACMYNRRWRVKGLFDLSYRSSS